MGNSETASIKLKIKTKYLDDMMQTIIAEKYDTLTNLRTYSIEEFLAVYELAYVKQINRMIDLEAVRRGMKK